MSKCTSPNCDCDFQPGSCRAGINISEAIERTNVGRAKYLIRHEGKDLPVTNLFDSDGNEVNDPRVATRCVAYDKSLPGAKWVAISDDSLSDDLTERKS